MKYLIPLILLFPSLVFAVDDATVSEIDSKASSANSKADGNSSRIQALEAEDIVLHERIDAIDSLPVGASPGDILYWDGSVWQLTPAPPVSATPLTLTLMAGVPTWTEAGAGVVYAIGDTGPAGGKVFYITADGLHGLEVAPEDLPSVPWGCYGTELVGANGTRLGSGARNTSDILSGCAETGRAADLADAYTLNGYYDWYLPSIDELHLLFQQRNVVGGFERDGYWSSSEYDGDLAWIHSFITGFMNPGAKDFVVIVARAVRAF